MPRSWPAVTLRGYIPPRELNPNGRPHWIAKWRENKAARELAWAAVKEMGWPLQHKADPPRRLTITIYRAGTLADQDNCVASCKGVIDGVVAAGALCNDSGRWLELVVRQEACRRAEQRTVLELQDVGADLAPHVEALRGDENPKAALRRLKEGDADG